MAEDKYACVRALLCPLGDAVISALKGFVNVIIAKLEVEIAAVESILLTINIPYQAALVSFNVLQEILNEMEQYANLIPPALTNGTCFALGKNGADLRDSIDELTEEVREAKREVLLRLSLKQYYDEYLEDLKDKRDDLKDWMNNLNCAEMTTS